MNTDEEAQQRDDIVRDSFLICVHLCSSAAHRLLFFLSLVSASRWNRVPEPHHATALLAIVCHGLLFDAHTFKPLLGRKWIVRVRRDTTHASPRERAVDFECFSWHEASR